MEPAFCLMVSRHFAFDTGTRSFLKILSGSANIFLTSYLVLYLGKDQFGVYKSAIAAVSMLALAGGGMSAAAYGLVVKYIAQDDKDGVKRVVGVSLRYLIPIGGLVILGAWPCSILLAQLYNIPESLRGQFIPASALSACSLAFGFFAMPFIWVAQARQKEHVLNIFQMPLVVLTPICVILAVKGWPYAWIVALITVLFVLIGNTVNVCISLVLHKWLRPPWGTGETAVAGRTKFGMLEQVAAVMIGQSLAWGVTFNSGPASFGVVAASMTFFAFSRDLLTTVSSTLVAPIGGLFHSDQKDRAIRAWADSLLGLVLIGGSVAGALGAMNSFIIKIWLGDSMDAGSLVAAGLAFTLFLTVINSPSAAVLYAIGGFKARAWLLLLEGVSGLIFAFLGARFFGGAGAVFGISIAQIPLVLIYMHLIQKRLDCEMHEFFMNFFRLVLVLGLATTTLLLVVSKAPPTSLISTVIYSIIAGAFLLLTGWYVGLSNKSRTSFMQRFIRIVVPVPNKKAK